MKNEDKIKLLRSDYRTGIVLDENYIFYNEISAEKQIDFTYFDDLESAINYINANKNLHTNVEFHIYINDEPAYEDISALDLTTDLYLTPNYRRNWEATKNNYRLNIIDKIKIAVCAFSKKLKINSQ